MLNKAESWSQIQILAGFFMLKVIVLRFAVNSFRATVEWEFTIGNNYSLSNEGIWKLYVNSFRSIKEHTVEQTANKKRC